MAVSPRAVRHAGRIYGKLIAAHIHAKLSYEVDFWIGVVAMLMIQSSGLAFAWTLLSQRPVLAGWTFPEIALVYGMAIIPRGVVELLFDGQWQLPQLVYAGELDRLLVRPVPVILQVATQAVGLHGIGTLALGAVLLARAHSALHLVWRWQDGVLLAGTLVASSVLLAALSLIAHALVFWQSASAASTSLAVFTFNLTEVAKFPISMYGRTVQLLLTWLLPIGFLTYYPSLALLGKPVAIACLPWLALPIAALGAIAAAVVWHRGLGRYTGAGS